MTLTRVSITIPPDLVNALDRLATTVDRSRSWLVVEAVRRYLGSGEDSGAPGLAAAEARRDSYHAGGPGDYRITQLEADLRLTPEDRVREAEVTASLAEAKRREWDCQRVLVFESYEDYLAWERAAELSSP